MANEICFFPNNVRSARALGLTYFVGRQNTVEKYVPYIVGMFLMDREITETALCLSLNI